MKEIDNWVAQFKKKWETQFNQLDKVLLTLKKAPSSLTACAKAIAVAQASTDDEKMNDLQFDFTLDKSKKMAFINREFVVM